MDGTTLESELPQRVLAESSADSSPRDESFEEEDANDGELNNANAVCNVEHNDESVESDYDGKESRALHPLAALDTSSEIDETPSLATPTFATSDTSNQGVTNSTKKFVHFLSHVESTPIQSRKVFADDDTPVTMQRNHHRIEEGMEDDDEKKEEVPSVASTLDEDVSKNIEGLIMDSAASAKILSDDARNAALPTRERSDSCPDIAAPTATPSLPIIPPTAATAATTSPSRISYVSPPGRRTISLHLLEEIDASTSNTKQSPFQKFSSLRRFRSLSLSTVMVPLDEKNKAVLTDALESKNEPSVIDRGIITVSWYEGTTSSEMQEHVYNCVLRKLKSVTRGGGGEKKKLEDVRLLDESVVPHEEVVLCPFLPDGSHFLLKFKTSTPQPPQPKQQRLDPYNLNRIPPYISRAPDSPSAEPSPYPSSANLHGMNGNGTVNANVNAQLQLLNAATALLQSNGIKAQSTVIANGLGGFGGQQQLSVLPKIPMLPNIETVPREFSEHQPTSAAGTVKDGNADGTVAKDVASNSPSEKSSTDELIEQQLRQLNELFALRNGSSRPSDSQPSNEMTSNQEEDDHDPVVKYWKTQEKKQVIFTIANYFVLFMSLIALSAEIQSRLPQWLDWVQENYDSAQNCATNPDALFECISKGNFSGLVASFMLWATQSASAKRIFLFGFDTPKKLWTVVYEALCSAVCWGVSYLFIRRGLNPNTREKFIQKYWKDAVYGSLAGFNAAFMKAILKNLVPQDVALQAIETRQLRIFNWLGMLMSEE